MAALRVLEAPSTLVRLAYRCRVTWRAGLRLSRLGCRGLPGGAWACPDGGLLCRSSRLVAGSGTSGVDGGAWLHDVGCATELRDTMSLVNGAATVATLKGQPP